MKKLALNIDDLKVVSFRASSGSEDVRGTVRGNDTYWDACGSWRPTDCSSPTCDDSCACETQPPYC
ncbi:MAG TPA: hypothetical protein VEX86_18320 [Longimicrobium sp.]|nr:hypothetical protein [Longimicrobium sp.]